MCYPALGTLPLGITKLTQENKLYQLDTELPLQRHTRRRYPHKV
jgi:hypothetical protein